MDVCIYVQSVLHHDQIEMEGYLYGVVQVGGGGGRRWDVFQTEKSGGGLRPITKDKLNWWRGKGGS